MNAPIFQFNRHRDEIEREVVERTVAELGRYGGVEPPRSYQLVLNDAAFREIDRLEHMPDADPAPLERWKRLARKLGRMSQDELVAECRALCAWYVADVQGHFDRRVYNVATRVLPVGLGLLFKGTDLASGVQKLAEMRTLPGLDTLRDLSQRIRIEGELPTIRKLSEIGTLVVVPTHSSNMDSIVLGWSLMEAELPPVTYGAGKNLFSNPLIGYFMRNLGAYRVDRRLRHALYKEVLKTYSQVLLERGFHSLFFPGGTRCRSGKVERKLKLGLLGSALEATSERLQRGDERPIFIVPCTINYPLVLEAETLIEDYLREAGQARYIIEDDEFSKLGRVSHYALKVMGLNTSMAIRFGTPMDVFGNPVGADGISRGPDGTPLRRERYLFRDGAPHADAARDAEYTRGLGRAVADAFLRETVLMPTQFAGWLMLERERRRAPNLDLFALLRTTSGDVHPQASVCEDAEWLRARLVTLESQGRLRLDPALRQAPIASVLDEAVATFGMYHLRPALERLDDGGLLVGDPKLLYFYGNRLDAWATELRAAFAAGGEVTA
jgi:glycerol-3-phosphate O-acyltransferase